MSRSDTPSPTQPLLSRRHVLIGGAMFAASGLALARIPQAFAPPIRKQLFQSWIPDTAGPWRFVSASGLVLPPPDALSDRTYDNLITRVYVADSLPPIMLLIAYNNTQSGVLQVHRPEICYPVGGYELTETRKMPLAISERRTLPVRRFSARSPDRTEQVLYWTRVGDLFPQSWAAQRLAVARANLSGRIPDAAMVRVSMLSDNAEGSSIPFENFVRSFLAACPAPLRHILIGGN